MKRITAFVLTLALMVTTLLCFNVSLAHAATSGTWGDDVTWSYDASTTTLTFTGTGAIKDCGEIAIGSSKNQAPWLDYKPDITKIVISEGITEIGEYNFYNCTALKTVSLPSTLTVIGGSGVYDVGGTTDVTRGAFRDCTALESIVLPGNLTTIEKHAFSGCTSLKSITIPDSVTSLGDFAFRGCSSLATVTYGTGLTSTGKYAFYNAGVKTINFSSTITAVDNYAFFGCTMTSVELPDTITSVGTRAFANCSFLSKVTVYNQNCTFNGIAAEDPFNGSSQAITFYGHTGSTTETFVADHADSGYTFVSIDTCPHINVREEETVSPTCTETGIMSTICNVCGFVVSETQLPANGHTWVVTETRDESEENGHIYTASQCSVCNEEKTEIEHVAYVEGFYDYTNTATCTKPGIETYTCTVENCGSVTRNYASAGNHTVEVYTSVTDPTCTEDGSRTGVCTICGETVTETLPATGHTNELTETLDNTTTDGHTYEVYTCSVCGEVTSVPTHVEWVEGNYTSTVLITPKCVIDGTQRDVCNICGESRNVTLPANGQHDWYETSRTEPTCTAVGKIYYACNNCTLTKSENIDALGHDYQLVEESSVAPTCTTAGYNTEKCTRCSASRREVLNALGHTIDETNYTILQEPTCETDGSASSVCTVCSEEFDIVIEALGHNFENVVVPIEEKPGHSLSTPTCTRCNATQAATTVHDEWVEGHYGTSVTTEGNCTVPKVTTDTCYICGTTRTNTYPAPGHKLAFSKMSDRGALYYDCTVCGSSVIKTPS
ncbi:MAG: leucine-rich repeat domain-containing protein, partial [Eubacterium sp.]